MAVVAMASVFLGAAPASAHASLVASTPDSGSVVQQRPTQVRLTFSEPVEAERGAVVVTAPDGTPLAGARPSTDPKDRTTVVAALPRLLAPGTYRVTYRVPLASPDDRAGNDAASGTDDLRAPGRPRSGALAHGTGRPGRARDARTSASPEAPVPPATGSDAGCTVVVAVAGW